MSDETILRRRIGELGQNTPNQGQGSPAYLGRTYDGGSYPTSVPRMFLTRPLSVVSDETENATPNYVAESGSSVPVLILGPAVPAVGSNVMARLTNGMWVSGGGSGSGGSGGITIPLPGCPCTTTPASLVMTSTNHTANFGMFQDALITWQPTPSYYVSLMLGSHIFISTTRFTDGLTGEIFHYYLACDTQGYILKRLFEHTSFASPYQDDVRYRWTFSLPGSSCEPFSLGNGHIYNGGDPAMNGAITIVPG